MVLYKPTTTAGTFNSQHPESGKMKKRLIRSNKYQYLLKT